MKYRFSYYTLDNVMFLYTEEGRCVSVTEFLLIEVYASTLKILNEISI